MALKTSNKNRKKVEQQKNEEVIRQNDFENKIFTKNYVIAFVLLTIFIFVFI
jgi:hypothetical protein